MQIVILLSKDVPEDISELILGHKLEGGYSIDYALNSLVSYHNGKEIIIFNFYNYLAYYFLQFKFTEFYSFVWLSFPRDKDNADLM